MKNFLLIFSIVFAISGCAENERTVYVTPVVPESLRQTVHVPKRDARTLADVGILLTDHVEALATANGRIESIDCILDAAEARAEPMC